MTKVKIKGKTVWDTKIYIDGIEIKRIKKATVNINPEHPKMFLELEVWIDKLIVTHDIAEVKAGIKKIEEFIKDHENNAENDTKLST